MNRMILTALLPLAAFAVLSATTLASAAPSPSTPAATIVDNTGNPVNQNMLYTESRWERVMLPPEALGILGNLKGVKLSVANLPKNVLVSLVTVSPTPGENNTVGLWVRRSSRAQAVHQKGRFTLTNPATQASYTFDAVVVGAGR